MYLKNNDLLFSPSDLTLYMDSPFASWMAHLTTVYPEECDEIEADEEDSLMKLLQDKGYKHEEAVLNSLKAKGLTVADLKGQGTQQTLEAMQQGVDVIFQAVLEKSPFRGHSDFLVKVSGQSDLGDYHYEVWDTKLAKSLKPYFAVQLCCYEEMLAELQGRRSEEFVVVLGNENQERLRTDDYYYYYLSLKDAFLKEHAAFAKDQQPDPADSTSWGQWADYAKQRLEEADHLSQVATMTRSQSKKLNAAGIRSMQGLIDSELEFVKGLNPVIYQRLKNQARLQKASVGQTVPEFEILPGNDDEVKGLALLPPHSDQDVFFDIEGFPLDDGGLEYLWGNCYFDEHGTLQFKDFWAHDREQEKRIFKEFINWVYGRWQKDSSMHIYHYANYEIAACRKLMSRYGICEYEVDQLLRNEVFVDLYKIVKGGMLVGEPRYSIKNIEHLYRGKRDTDVGDGGESVVVYEQWRESDEGDSWETSAILKSIRDYNIDDCESTKELVDWLRDQQKKNEIQYSGMADLIEPEIKEEISRRTALRDRLLARAETLQARNIGQETDDGQAKLIENLAWVLEFHRREAKPVFWRLFDRLGLTSVELLDDPDCLSDCRRTEKAPFKPTPRSRILVHEYRFDVEQAFKSINTQSFYVLGQEDEDGRNITASVVHDHCDFENGLIVLRAKQALPEMISLVPDEYVQPASIPGAIEDVVTRFENGSLGECAILDFLQRKAPRIKGVAAGQALIDASDPSQRVKQISKAIQNLEGSYLPIQGPPGTGKTFTGKQVIADLVARGKKVGICSNSHKAINNLLAGTAEFCQQNNIEADFFCAKNTGPELEELGVSIVANPKIAEHIDGLSACVVGTTAWGFSRDDLQDTFDYLFIDEAGQVSVANLIAISRSAKNLVLMGDQMQLGQPTQGTHPAESGLSILDYLLHEQPTISDDMGIFLGTTYRMHPAINGFISDAVYEGKLRTDPDNEKQIVKVPKDYNGVLDKQAGIIYVPVEHEGNTQASDEEAQMIAQLSNQLLGRTFVDKDGKQRKIKWQDMLFVAPYNLQVNTLQSRLGDKARVGSVDKFQGQEAPIVFLSMCASDANESPRGIDFLFDKQRLNVAVSRAQTLTIVVGSPALRKQQASNLKQQNRLNLYCWLTAQSVEIEKSGFGMLKSNKKAVPVDFDSAELLKP